MSVYRAIEGQWNYLDHLDINPGIKVFIEKTSENWKGPQEAISSRFFQVKYQVSFVNFLIKLQDDSFPAFI